MKKHVSPINGQTGFTLVEIIATLVITAIVGAMLFQFFETSLSRSANALVTARNESEVQGTLEFIISDYVRLMNSNNFGTALAGLIANINDGDYDMSENIQVTTDYITFSGPGDFSTSGSATDTLLVTVSLGNVTLSTLLANARTQATDASLRY